MQNDLNILANRQAAKYSKAILARRVLWGLVQPLFRFSPRTFFEWRSFLLRLFGARIGRGVHIYSSVTIYFPWMLEVGHWTSIGEHAFIYNLGTITLGSKVTISQRAHLCAGTHDYTRAALPLLLTPIAIADKVWICADAFVGPGVSIGEGAVVGARAVVTKDVEPWTVVAGNPAVPIKKRIMKDN